MTDLCISATELYSVTEAIASDLASAFETSIQIGLNGQVIANNAFNGRGTVFLTLDHDTAVLTSIDNREKALAVWRGLVYRKFVHTSQAEAAWSQYLQAIQIGCQQVFHLLNDEQIVRRLISDQPSWENSLQKMMRFMYPFKARESEKISATTAGSMAIGMPQPGSISHTKEYGKRFNLFAYCFRRGSDEKHWQSAPAVAKAMALLPEDLKTLSKDQLLELASKIHAELSAGIEPEPVLSTEPPKPAPAKAPVKPVVAPAVVLEPAYNQPFAAVVEPEPEKEADEEVVASVKEKADDKKSWFATWLGNKSFVGTTLVCVAVFTGLFMKAGYNFWTVVAGLLSSAAIITSVVLWTFRSQIGRTLLGVLGAICESIADCLGGIRKAFGRMFAGIGRALDHPVVKKGARYLTCAIGLLMVVLAVHYMPLKWVIGLGCLAGFVGCLVFMKVQEDYRESESAEDGRYYEYGKGAGLMMAVCGIGFFGSLIWIVSQCPFSWMVEAILYLIGFFAMGYMLCMAALYIAPADQSGYANGNGKVSIFARMAHALKSAKNAIVFVVKSLCAGFCIAFIAVCRLLKFCIEAIWGCFWTIVCWCGSLIAAGWRYCAKQLKLATWGVEPMLYSLWNQGWLRCVVMAIPIAMLVAAWRSVLASAGKGSIWVEIVLFLISAVLVVLVIAFRKQLYSFVVKEASTVMPELFGSAQGVPLDLETEGFDEIKQITPIAADKVLLTALSGEVEELAGNLREALGRLGQSVKERDHRTDGYQMGDEPEVVLVGDMAFKQDEIVQKSVSVHLELALNCSTSMVAVTQHYAAGQAFNQGLKFGLALEQALSGISNVSTHLWGFDDANIYDCGSAGEGRLSGLRCFGSNNDSAMLSHMRKTANESGKDIRIIVMVDDGQPAESSWRSLYDLGKEIECDEGTFIVMVRLDDTNPPALDRFVVNLFDKSLEAGLAEFAAIVDTIDEMTSN